MRGRKKSTVTNARTIYRKAAQLMHDEAPVVFLFGGYDFYGVSNKLEGIVPRGDQRFFLQNVSLKP